MVNTWVEAWCITALSPRVLRSVSVCFVHVVRSCAVSVSGEGNLGGLIPVGTSVDRSGVACLGRMRPTIQWYERRNALRKVAEVEHRGQTSGV